MKKIAVITMGVQLPGEKGYSRFRFIAEYLCANGFDVDLITSSFQHWEKKQRNIIQVADYEKPYGLYFIKEPGYKKNIDIRRIYSHDRAAKNIKMFLNEHDDYDLIYAEIPPNDVALAIGTYAKEKGIPFVVDVNDLWPEAMRMVIDIPIISNLLFYPLKRDAEKVYNLVSAVIGTSDEYRDRPVKNNLREIPRKTVYVGNELSEFDAGVVEFSSQIKKPADEFWVTYAGTWGTSYDLSTLIAASAILIERGYNNIRIKMLGGGPTEDALKKQASQINCSVDFIGYMPYKKMAAYLAKSDILVNSFVKKAPQSIVTKIGDYLSAGKPMINTCMSPEFRAKVGSQKFGINIMPEDADILADAIDSLYKASSDREKMGEIAREIAEKEFDRPRSYQIILNLIKEILADKYSYVARQ